MNIVLLKIKVAKLVKNIFGISNLTLYMRKKKHNIEKIFYKKKFKAEDIINILRQSGVTPGVPVIVHSAFGNMYNLDGTANDLINALIEYLGPNGTLCMPAFPKDKYNTNKVFDLANTLSAAGYLTEVFRKRKGVKRSMNQLHSVCALGKDADLITGDHHNSYICFDEHSPFYIIGQLDGYIVNLGMPKWYIGTGEHVCEALLYNRLHYFKNKFTQEYTFTYKSTDGSLLSHTMRTKSKYPYVRCKSTKIFDEYFDTKFYKRVKLSNMWVTIFNMRYLYTRLSELAIEGKTIYSSPKF